MITVLNDLHIGAIRTGGATPATAYQLRQDLLRDFEKLVDDSLSLIILGDLFDTAQIPMADVLATWKVLRKHCANGAPLWLVEGNHDRGQNLTVLTSFQFLCGLLKEEFPNQVTVVDQPYTIEMGYDIHIIPHLANQDLFDAALAAAPPCSYLMVHANYDNNFAVQSDHSLNVSKEQAQAAKCEMMIFAHEHQQREELDGKVLVIGNQFPSSVADCLGNDRKWKLEIPKDNEPSLKATWHAQGDFCEMDWHDLNDNGCRFIRVVGQAAASEAGDVVQAISKFRSKSKTLVITNATSVEGAGDSEQLQMNLEEVKTFDVFAAVLECLDEREKAVIMDLYRPTEATNA